MRKKRVLRVSGVGFCSACSSNNIDCEDVTLASEQAQQCKTLHKKIANNKSHPLIRSELERRYQQDCIDVRYYRDEHQQGICGNKKSLEEIKKTGLKD